MKPPKLKVDSKQGLKPPKPAKDHAGLKPPKPKMKREGV